MARRQGWSIFVSFVLGMLGASLFCFYTPFFKGSTAGPTATEAGKGGLSLKEAARRQASGSRFQMVSDGQQVFLADLKEGRVWRYFHVTRDSREEEGFLSVPMFYEGKQYLRASEVGEREPAQGEQEKLP
jgi:hypothetical protein